MATLKSVTLCSVLADTPACGTSAASSLQPCGDLVCDRSNNLTRQGHAQSGMLLLCRAVGYAASSMGLGACAQQVVVTPQLQVLLQLANSKFVVICHAAYK